MARACWLNGVVQVLGIKWTLQHSSERRYSNGNLCQASSSLIQYVAQSHVHGRELRNTHTNPGTFELHPGLIRVGETSAYKNNAPVGPVHYGRKPICEAYVFAKTKIEQAPNACRVSGLLNPTGHVLGAPICRYGGWIFPAQAKVSLCAGVVPHLCVRPKAEYVGCRSCTC